jgi:hypothetical protein
VGVRVCCGVQRAARARPQRVQPERMPCAHAHAHAHARANPCPWLPTASRVDPPPPPSAAQVGAAATVKGARRHAGRCVLPALRHSERGGRRPLCAVRALQLCLVHVLLRRMAPWARVPGRHRGACWDGQAPGDAGRCRAPQLGCSLPRCWRRSRPRMACTPASLPWAPPQQQTHIHAHTRMRTHTRTHARTHKAAAARAGAPAPRDVLC